jgi:hypothetical protein
MEHGGDSPRCREPGGGGAWRRWCLAGAAHGLEEEEGKNEIKKLNDVVEWDMVGFFL